MTLSNDVLVSSMSATILARLRDGIAWRIEPMISRLGQIYRRTAWVTYQWPQNGTIESQRNAHDVAVIDEALVHTYFETDTTRKTQFLNFLAKRYVGVLVHSPNTWLTYAWMSTPGNGGPPHHGPELQDLDAHWIFWCRTNDAHQGRGLYKLALRSLVSIALDSSPSTPIYIDTTKDNIASRCAILSVGFEPRGIVVTSHFLPSGWTRTRSRWSPAKRHPRIKAAVA